MIANQTFHDFECIIVDDGSTDGSDQVCDSIVSLDDRFRAIHISNGGVSNARNVGLENATGKYVAFIDADDELEVNYLQSLYDQALESKAEMIVCSYARIRDDSTMKEKMTYDVESKTYLLAELLPQFAVLQRETGIFGWCWGKLILASIAQKEKFDCDLRLAEDFDYYLKLYPNVNKICIYNKPLYLYRVNAENGSMISAEDDKIDYYSQLIISIRYRDFLINQKVFSDRNKAIVNELMSNYAVYTLFHSKMSRYYHNFDKVYNVWNQYAFPLNGKDIHSKVLLFCLRWRLLFCSKQYLRMYRFVRDIVRQHRRIKNVN